MPTIDDLKSVRIQKLEALKKQGIDPFPATILHKHTVAKARAMIGRDAAVAGRIMGLRGHGKIFFLDIGDATGTIQVVLKSDQCDAKAFELTKFIDLGDFLAVQGEVGRTQAGEVSVFTKNGPFAQSIAEKSSVVVPVPISIFINPLTFVVGVCVST